MGLDVDLIGKYWKDLQVFMAKTCNVPPKDHPKPFQSVLWSHLDLIRSRRRRRQPWRVIVAELETEYKIKTTAPTLMRFVKRVSDRTPEGAKSPILPVGFTESQPAEELTISKITTKPEPGSVGERIQAEAKEEREKLQSKQSKWSFGEVYQDKQKHDANHE